MDCLYACQEDFNEVASGIDESDISTRCACMCSCANCGRCGCSCLCDLGNCNCRFTRLSNKDFSSEELMSDLFAL